VNVANNATSPQPNTVSVSGGGSSTNSATDYTIVNGAVSSSGIYYYLEDQLGTSRVIANSSGNICYDADFYPYGGERIVVDTCPQNYKFNGKERDIETNLDNFGARYNASTMGRFMTPDPDMISKDRLADPQRWNMYAYVRNNPLRFTDSTGKSIELTGNDEERKKQLAALQKAAGQQAGKYLYENVDKKTGKHYVGIYKNGPDGKGPSFNSINAVSNKLGGIIQDNRVATIQFVDPSTVKAGVTLGSASDQRTPGASYAAPLAAQVFLARGDLGTFPAVLTEGNESEGVTLDTVLMHELGHVDSVWFHNGTDSNGDAVRIEDQVRAQDGLSMRIGHSEPYDVPLSDMPF
jgi:RHS repeat-associated protein